MLQNFSQTQGIIFHSSACIFSSEGFFKNRSAHFCGKSPSSGACPSQIAILLSLGLKFLMNVKTDLHLRRSEFLRLPAGFHKPFQLTETRGFADHFLKISRSDSSGNLNYSNFPPRGADWSVMMSCTISSHFSDMHMPIWSVRLHTNACWSDVAPQSRVQTLNSFHSTEAVAKATFKATSRAHSFSNAFRLSIANDSDFGTSDS